MQRDVMVVSGVRTAVGDFGGGLKDVPPTDLGAQVVREALARAEVDGAEVGHVVDDIYGLMTRRAPVREPPAGQPPASGIALVLHKVGTNLMAGMMEALAAAPYNGRADLPALAGALQLEADDLFPLGESLQLLHFATVAEGDIALTDLGRAFANADTDDRKRLFADALRANVPLVAMIRRVLDERWNHRASAVRFFDELEDHMSPEYAADTMRAAIAWGRYAELYSYDEEAEQFSLEEVE